MSIIHKKLIYINVFIYLIFVVWYLQLMWYTMYWMTWLKRHEITLVTDGASCHAKKTCCILYPPFLLIYLLTFSFPRLSFVDISNHITLFCLLTFPSCILFSIAFARQ
jgi:hypothetical protein